MPTVKKLIGILSKEVGYREGRDKDGSWNNHEKYADQVPGLEWVDNAEAPWCATFASWAYLKAGLKPNADFPVSASCDVSRGWYRSHNRISEFPVIGGQAFYGKPSDSNHTGIVVAFDADHITAIEGNTNDTGAREGDGVYRKVRIRRATNVLDYGIPFHLDGMESANPKGDSRIGPVAPAKPSKPGKPTLVQQAKALLTKAVRNGRTGKVKKARDLLPPK